MFLHNPLCQEMLAEIGGSPREHLASHFFILYYIVFKKTFNVFLFFTFFACSKYLASAQNTWVKPEQIKHSCNVLSRAAEINKCPTCTEVLKPLSLANVEPSQLGESLPKLDSLVLGKT